MHALSLLARIDRLQEQLAVRLAPLAAFATRAILGHAFVLTGLGKLRNLERTSDFFASLGIPLPGSHAVGIGLLELVGGALLVLGLRTRTFAALLSATMIVALATADRSTLLEYLQLSGEPGFTQVVPLTFLVLLGWLFVNGAGRWSFDQRLASSDRTRMESR
ncbi:MAG: DoxX family protein [Planctomycetes bacterium]|nr:DoxX family protein [Planctomycetota bacterium]